MWPQQMLASTILVLVELLVVLVGLVEYGTYIREWASMGR